MTTGWSFAPDSLDEPSIYVDAESKDTWTGVEHDNRTYVCKPKPIANKTLGSRIHFKEVRPLTFVNQMVPSVDLMVWKVEPLQYRPVPEELTVSEVTGLRDALLGYPVERDICYEFRCELSKVLFHIHAKVTSSDSGFISRSTCIDVEWIPDIYRPAETPKPLYTYITELDSFKKLQGHATGGVFLTGAAGFGKKLHGQVLAQSRRLSLTRVFARTLVKNEDPVLRLRRLYARAKPSTVFLFFDIEELAQEEYEHALKTLYFAITVDRKDTLTVMTSAHPERIQTEFLQCFPEISLDPPSLVNRHRLMELLYDQKIEYCQINRMPGYLIGDMLELRRIAPSAQEIESALKQVKASLVQDHRVSVPIEVTWDDIAGIDELKEKLRRTIEWPLTKAESYKKLGIRAPRGILLHGPPGCSKTTIAKAVANSGGFSFYSLSGATIYSCYVGESERIVREAFRSARQAAPSIIFIDEIDAIVGKRQGTEFTDVVQERILSTFLNEMDGVEEHKEQILILGATNRRDAIDDAILRPGRFDHVIEVPLPDAHGRSQILRFKTKHMSLEGPIDFDALARATPGCSGADLSALVQEAGLVACRLRMDRITQAHFDEALAILSRELINST